MSDRKLFIYADKSSIVPEWFASIRAGSITVRTMFSGITFVCPLNLCVFPSGHNKAAHTHTCGGGGMSRKTRRRNKARARALHDHHNNSNKNNIKNNRNTISNNNSNNKTGSTTSGDSSDH